MSIVTTRQDEFWRPVVSRDDVRCVETIRTENFGAAKITDFNDSLGIHQNIFGFQIAMTNTNLMAEVHSYQNLAHKVFDLIHLNQSARFFSILNDFFKILLTEFED